MDSDSVISRLAQIETGASQVLDDAVAKKADLNEAMKKKAAEFDAAKDAETAKKVEDLKVRLKKDTDDQLLKLRENVKNDLARIQEHYDKSHDAWSDEIIRDLLK